MGVNLLSGASKGIVHPKIIILSLFTHVVPNLYDYLSENTKGDVRQNVKMHFARFDIRDQTSLVIALFLQPRMNMRKGLERYEVNITDEFHSNYN